LVAIPQNDIVAIENVQHWFTKCLHSFVNYSYSERLSLLNLPSLELRPLRTDLIWCYKLIFDRVNISFCNLFELRSEFVKRGHSYQIFKHHYSCTARSAFYLSVLLIFGTVAVVDFSSPASRVVNIAI